MHNSNYYGKDNPFEPIKIIDYYNFNFSLGNVIKYVCRAGKKEDNSRLQDLRKASDYLLHEIEKIERENECSEK